MPITALIMQQANKL